MRTFGLIPAAGKSVRMGQPKLLLPLGGQTVLARVVAAVRDGGVTDVLVVVGPAGDAVETAALHAGAHVLKLTEDTADMRETCQRGLDWLASQFQPGPGDGWLLLPADHPTTRPAIVRTLLEAATNNPQRSIIVPVCEGRRGHPVWLRWEHAAALRSLPMGQGLNALVRGHAENTLELPWPDPEVLRDLDTPEEYERLLREVTTAAMDNG
jgi:molybdenum cofactor cytidylyltransferase